MKIYSIPLDRPRTCENCEEGLPARVRIIIGGHFSARLCAMCIGVMTMEIAEILKKIDVEESVH